MAGKKSANISPVHRLSEDPIDKAMADLPMVQHDENSPNKLKKHARTRRINTLCQGKVGTFFRNPDNILLILTVFAVIMGLLLGLILKINCETTERQVYLISFPGVLFMNMLKMLIIPLIISSLVTGLAGLDTKSSGKIGLYSMLYYVLTTMAAVILGIILVLCIHPGSATVKKGFVQKKEFERVPGTLDSFLDLLRNIFPENVVQACLQQQQSIITVQNINQEATTNEISVLDASNASQTKSIETMKIVYKDSTNILGLVTFSIAIGIILGEMGEQALVMIQFFAILNDVIMRLVKVIMWYSPVGIFFLIMGKILEIENLQATASSLAWYMMTVILGLIIHTFFTLSLLYFAVSRKNPFKFMKGMFQAWITALGTASSAATLPVSFRCLEENLGIDSRVTRFVLPIGATINMDGTALYEAVATIFIAQINEKNLSIIEVIVISVTATLAAIGAASVPSAGIVTMMLVLSSVGLPTDNITLIIAVDWLLDRMRTSVNVLGDAFGAGIVHHLCRSELAPKDVDGPHCIDNVFKESIRIRRSRQDSYVRSSKTPFNLMQRMSGEHVTLESMDGERDY